MKNTIAERILDFLKDFPPFDCLEYDQLFTISSQVKVLYTEEEQATKFFLEHIKDAVLVAHHAAFDIAMINEGLARLDLPKLRNKVIDTGALYRKTKYIKEHKHYSLDDLCKMFNLVMHDRHTASGDAFLTALIFLKISNLLRKKKNGLKLKYFFSWF
ncbi:MAG: 3'-5' exonuclease [Psychroserpens sp.]|nr:3'-5' exonuclease [Psychroserpens sp.]